MLDHNWWQKRWSVGGILEEPWRGGMGKGLFLKPFLKPCGNHIPKEGAYRAECMGWKDGTWPTCKLSHPSMGFLGGYKARVLNQSQKSPLKFWNERLWNEKAYPSLEWTSLSIPYSIHTQFHTLLNIKSWVWKDQKILKHGFHGFYEVLSHCIPSIYSGLYGGPLL